MTSHGDQARSVGSAILLTLSVGCALAVAAVVLTIILTVVQGVSGIVDLLRHQTVSEQPMPADEWIGRAAFDGWHCTRTDADKHLVVCEPRPLHLDSDPAQ